MPENTSNGASSRLVSDVQRRLTAISWTKAIALGVGAAVSTWLFISLLVAFAWPDADVAIANSVAVLVALIAFGAAAFFAKVRDGDITRPRAALWLEERFPSLQFALVTLNEVDTDKSRDVSASARARLVSAVGAPNIAPPLNRSAWRQLRVPVLLAALMIIVAGPLQARLLRDGNDSSVAGGTNAGVKAGGKKSDAKALANWKVRVVPPAYSALEASNIQDASQVTALVGSRIEIIGEDTEAPTAIVRSTVDSIAPAPLSITRTATGWRTQFVMPVSPADARFTLGSANRQLLLEPRADSVPVVHLTRPARDSVFREAKGNIALDASAHDDLGLATVNFELIVTSGEGERFTAKTLVLGALRLAGERERKWQSSFSLDTMKLVAGDIVHMRAVARDRHPGAAHELGASETRTFRIARPSEYDSVAVEPAPPPEVQKSLMSQRMLLILTEKLAARVKSMSRGTLVSESRKLASDQVMLRKAVGNLVFQRLEGEDSGEHSHSADDGHDHGVSTEQGKLVMSATGGTPMTDGAEGDSPIVSINKPLLEAFNAMFDAASALEIAEPKNAIPHMKIALAAIERARSAERIYLRGKPPVAIVDIAKVRLVGKDTGQVNARGAREALSPREAEREARLLSAALLLTRDASAGRDSLALLRLESLTDAPRLAAALNDALEVVRRGGDVTAALIRARRMIGGGVKSDSLGAWRGM
ncbi:MAG: hypothetical protein ABI120_12830 [Gemmatimonadaceae bacterium]